MFMKLVGDNIYQIKIPLPFPLKYVFSYAIKGVDGWTIIDTGLHTKETELVWEGFLKERDCSWNDIKRIILTHYHPDHLGAAGWLQQKTNATVYISNVDFEAALLFWYQSEDMGETMRDFYHLHGMPQEISTQMIFHLQEFNTWVSPKPNVSYLSDGEMIKIGDLLYKAILTPGHSDGHLCFYQPEHKILFVGDHILPKITPNISLWPKGTDRNPLKHFIESLNKIKNLDIQIAYPSHKSVLSDVHQRIDELLNHHKERLDQITQWIGEKTTAYQICEQMFGRNLSVHQLRFAMAETLAHLVYLEEIGNIKPEVISDFTIWRKC